MLGCQQMSTLGGGGDAVRARESTRAGWLDVTEGSPTPLASRPSEQPALDAICHAALSGVSVAANDSRSPSAGSVAAVGHGRLRRWGTSSDRQQPCCYS